MSWNGHRYEHGLSAKGIKTSRAKQIKMGIEVEAEHLDTIKRIIADAKADKLKPLEFYLKLVAEDHVDEIKDYYTRLNKLEKEAGIIGTVVIDIDGTILDVSARWDEAKKRAKPPSPKFWNEFMNPKLVSLDKPIPETVRKLNQLESLGMKIIYLSGRRANLTEETVKILEKYGYPKGRVILRKQGEETVNFKIMKLLKLNSENNIKVYIGDESRDLKIGKQTRIPSVRVMPNRKWDDNIWESIKKKATKNI